MAKEQFTRSKPHITLIPGPSGSVPLWHQALATNDTLRSQGQPLPAPLRSPDRLEVRVLSHPLLPANKLMAGKNLIVLPPSVQPQSPQGLEILGQAATLAKHGEMVYYTITLTSGR